MTCGVKKDKRYSSIIDIDFGKYSKTDLFVLIEQAQLSSKLGASQFPAICILKLFFQDAEGMLEDRFRKTQEEALERIRQEKELFKGFLDDWLNSNYGQAKLAGHTFWDVKQQRYIPFDPVVNLKKKGGKV